MNESASPHILQGQKDVSLCWALGQEPGVLGSYAILFHIEVGRPGQVRVAQPLPVPCHCPLGPSSFGGLHCRGSTM